MSYCENDPETRRLLDLNKHEAASDFRSSAIDTNTPLSFDPDYSLSAFMDEHSNESAC